jgi:L-asparaginase II
MRFARVRSGLHETAHDVVAYALDSSGREAFRSGDLDRPFFYRSAVKPFQAAASLQSGIRVSDEELAVICSSHGGFPAHIGLVQGVLRSHGRSVDDLRCPPGTPLNRNAEVIDVAAQGPRTARVLHNCSGKHAGWIAASATAGFSIDGYLDSDHPIQRQSFDILAEVTGAPAEMVGIDGCGAPTAAGTVVSLATAFRRLGTDPAFGRIASAMATYPAIVADNIRPDGRFGIVWSGPSKGGAEGLFAATRGGLTIVTKSIDGSGELAVAAAATVAGLLGAIGPGQDEMMEPLAAPAVLGGGRPVGRLELVER